MNTEPTDFERQVLEMIKNVATSAVFLTISPDPVSMKDVKVCLELAAALLWDKPIIAVCIDREADARILKIADKVIYSDNIEEATAEAARWIMEREVHDGTAKRQRRPKT